MKKFKINRDVILKVVRIIGKFSYVLFFAILVAVAMIVAVSTLKLPGSYKIFVVESGSMEPAILKGSIVISKPQGNYQKNDIITVTSLTRPKDSITHRIVAVEVGDKNISYLTKGDKNDAPDSEKRLKQNVIGKVVFSVPFLGFLVAFAKTLEGLIMLIIVPVVLIIYGELKTIITEAKNILRKKEKSTKTRWEYLN